MTINAKSMWQRFSARFEKIAVMHSGLTAPQRNTQWHKIKSGEADVVIGARSAVFAPLTNLGLIVVDEGNAATQLWIAARALGAAAVGIAEGPGHRRTTWDLAEAAGYFKTVPDFESLFTDLNLDEISEVRLPRPAKGLPSLWLPRTALDCDLLISLPKMKTHHWAGVTLGMKNLFGLVPGAVYGWPKNVLHWAGIDASIVAINSAIPNLFTIVDGVEGMEGNGPIQGRRKHAGVLVAGADRVAVDATCCRVMGVNPELVRHLVMAQTMSQTQEASVRQIGESLDAVRTDFHLLPEFSGLRLKVS